MASTTHVPVEVHLRSCYEPDVSHLIRGIVFEIKQIKDLFEK